MDEHVIASSTSVSSAPATPHQQQQQQQPQQQQQQQPQQQLQQHQPHFLNIHSYRSPHFCDVCQEMLWGLVKQGLKCEGCGLNFHKRCVYKIQGDCTNIRAVAVSLRQSGALPNSVSVVGVTTGGGSGPQSPSSVSIQPPGGSGHSESPPNSSSSSSIQSGPALNSSSSVNVFKGRGFSTAGTVVVGGLGGAGNQTTTRIQMPHTFVVHTFKNPTVCHHCRKLLPLFRQNYQCRDCKLKCHRECYEFVVNNCRGEARREDDSPSDDSSISGDVDGTCQNFGNVVIRDGGDMSLTSTAPNNDTSSNGRALPCESTVEDDEEEDEEEEGRGSERLEPTDRETCRSTSSSNIPLQRVIQSFKNTKGNVDRSSYIHEGWMVCYTSRDTTRKCHYWKLDSKSITLFSDNTSKRYYKEILLSNISSIKLASSQTTGGNSGSNKQSNRFVFELRVGDTVYYVGEESSMTNGQEKADPADVETIKDKNDVESRGVGRSKALSFEKAIQQAVMSLPQDNTTTDSYNASSLLMGRKQEDESKQKIEDISQIYQISVEDVLGSGQFGIVYGAIHRTKGHEVAIKVIDKLRFPNKQAAQLQNEVGILQNIHHPGVVNLEYMFETPAKIYIVMEKLKGDMLEMILTSPKGRLSERTTKFLVSQILIALRHLHSKSIVHCDLKPENVLLSSDSLFPQVKLCDFGFARIIGERSFRRSVVGTPAYVAPEVLKNKGYNRSLDMWSVGVIIYVSLSGTFPFNEDEDIHDQIQNASFMFPPSSWISISSDAIELITRILQVRKKRRMSVENCLGHIWLQDYQCWCDLRKLESLVGVRYLTHESDDERWNDYCTANSLPTWDIQGHKEMTATGRPPPPISMNRLEVVSDENQQSRL